MIDQLHPLGQFRVLSDSRLQPLHTHDTGLVIVQAQTDLCNVWMIVEELEHGAGRGASERKIVTVPPIAPGQLYQRSQREGVNGAFRYGQPGTLGVSCQQSKIVPLLFLSESLSEVPYFQRWRCR